MLIYNLNKNSRNKNVPHEVQSRATGLASSALHNLYTLHIRTEHLDGHLNTHTGKLVSQKDGGVNAAELDAQGHTVEGIAVLEGHPQNITRSDTSGVAAVIEQGLAFALRVMDGHLRLDDLGDRVFACFADRWRSGIDFDGLGT